MKSVILVSKHVWKTGQNFFDHPDFFIRIHTCDMEERERERRRMGEERKEWELERKWEREREEGEKDWKRERLRCFHLNSKLEFQFDILEPKRIPLTKVILFLFWNSWKLLFYPIKLVQILLDLFKIKNISFIKMI